MTNLWFSNQILEMPYKGASVPHWPILISSTGLVDLRTGSVPSYWILWGTYMEGCNYTNNCGMDSTHSTWCKQKGISLVPSTGSLRSCLQVSSTRLLAPMFRSSWLLLYVQACLALSSLSIVVLPLLRHCWLGQNAFLCRFDYCGWHCTRSSDSMPARWGHLCPL